VGNHLSSTIKIAAISATLVLTAACESSSPTEVVSVSDAPQSLSAPVAAKSADGVVHSIGLNVHMAYFQTVYGTGFNTIVKPRLAALGVRHLRDYGTVVADNNWMNTVYGRMRELSQMGMRFALVVKPGPSGSYSNLDHWPRLLSYALPVVENFQGLNEHDLSGRANWPAEVKTFQQALWNRIKSDPRTAHMPVFGPTLGRPGNAPLVGDISGILNYSSINSYPGGQTPLATLDYHRTKLQPMTKSRGFVATETGYHTATSWTGAHPPVSEQAQARYTPRLILEYYQAGLPRTYLYELIDQGTSLTNREMRFGLLRTDGSEKPAYRALANMIAVLKDQGPGFTPGSLPFTVTGDTVGLKRMLLQKRDGRFYLALWTTASSYNLTALADVGLVSRNVTVRFDTPMRKVQQYRPNVSAAATNTVANATAVNLSVDDRVLLVEITK
jgi:hypothetical protein